VDDLRIEKFEQLPNGTNVPVVLTYRVLEPEPLTALA
jgi:hypothetical protein